MTADIVKQLDPIFKARTVAVIGASNILGKWGNRMIQNPLNTGYRGKIFPVNPNEQNVLGMPTFPSVLDIPDDIDLAVIVVPAPIVPQVMEECVEKGVKGAVIISAGFAETGKEGEALQTKVKQIAERGGIRFVGPNCMGIWAAPMRLSLCFDPPPRLGPITFISQSGTFGGALARAAGEKGYGFSYFVSAGNAADLTNTDYLNYFGQDRDTKCIVFYMEGLRKGREFAEISREVVKKKPIIVYKAGQTTAGSKAAKSHTGSITGRDEIFDAMCKQVGIIRSYNTLGSFDMAEALSRVQPLPNGNRIAIIGSGGFSVVGSENAERLGLEIPEFDEDTKVKIAELLPLHAPPPRNPVDTAGGTPGPNRTKILEIVASLDYIDGIIVSGGYGRGFFYSLNDLKEALKSAEIMTSIPKKYGKTLIMWSRRSTRDVMYDVLYNSGILFFETIEDCMRAMQSIVTYAKIRKKK